MYIFIFILLYFFADFTTVQLMLRSTCLEPTAPPFIQPRCGWTLKRRAYLPTQAASSLQRLSPHPTSETPEHQSQCTILHPRTHHLHGSLEESDIQIHVPTGPLFERINQYDDGPSLELCQIHIQHQRTLMPLLIGALYCCTSLLTYALIPHFMCCIVCYPVGYEPVIK